MKSLNDLIWNDEQLDFTSQELVASSSVTFIDDWCQSLTYGLCDPNSFAVCNLEYATCNVTFANCEQIDPLKVNGCILPMGVSCGGGETPDISFCNPIMDPPV